MRNLLFIFIGGGVGSVLRYVVSVYTQTFFKIGSFPLGTLLVNLLGCLMIGVFTAAFAKTDFQLRYLLITGFCGGFTTFSAFSLENLLLWQSQQYSILLTYVLLSFILGLIAVYAGLKLYNFMT